MGVRMISNWQKDYNALTDFIIAHPEIEITASSISIPEKIRPEFYRLFDNTRTAFLEERLPGQLDAANSLSSSYHKIEQELISTLKLQDITLPLTLNRFLQNPMRSLIREQLNTLFDLLKNKIDIQTFETNACKNMNASFSSLFLAGYEKWVVLSLIKLLKTDRLFQIVLNPIGLKEGLNMADELGGVEVPFPEENNRIAFHNNDLVTFTVPDAIVHSNLMNRYLGFRTNYVTSMAPAANASNTMEWHHRNALEAHEPGLVLVYISDSPQCLALVADLDKICRPDLILDCRTQTDPLGIQELDRINRHNVKLAPKLGTFIVSMYPVPQQQMESGSLKNTRILTSGLDELNLFPIVEILARAQAATV
jgi:hypothetical protein